MVVIPDEINAIPAMIDSIEVIGNSLSNIAYDPINGRMYVTNSRTNTVSVIDTNTHSLVGNPITVGTNPRGIAYDPINGRMYVANFGSNTVSLIDTNTNRVIGGAIEVGTGPLSIAYDPEHQRMYATLLDNNSISIIDTRTNSLVGPPIKINTSPKDIAYDSGNGIMYITNFAENGLIYAINTTTNSLVGSPIEVDGIPQSIAFDSINQRIYVTNPGSDTISVINPNSSDNERSSIYVDAPDSLAYDPIKQRLYVSNIDNGLINIVDTKTNSVLDSPINVGDISRGLEYDPVNDRLFVPDNNSSSVLVVQLVSPNSTIISSIDGLGADVTNETTTTSDVITISFNETEAPLQSVLGYECSLDGSKFSPCISPQSYHNLEQDRKHMFKVRTVDVHGNVGQSEATLFWEITKATRQTADRLQNRCDELANLRENGINLDSVTKNSIIALANRVEDVSNISLCPSFDSSSSSGIPHENVNIDNITGSGIESNKNNLVEMSGDERPFRDPEGSMLKCVDNSIMSESDPFLAQRDNRCETDQGKIAESPTVLENAPQISSQQFKHRSNSTTQNIPLSLPF